MVWRLEKTTLRIDEADTSTFLQDVRWHRDHIDALYHGICVETDNGYFYSLRREPLERYAMAGPGFTRN